MQILLDSKWGAIIRNMTEIESGDTLSTINWRTANKPSIKPVLRATLIAYSYFPHAIMCSMRYDLGEELFKLCCYRNPFFAISFLTDLHLRFDDRERNAFINYIKTSKVWRIAWELGVIVLSDSFLPFPLEKFNTITRRLWMVHSWGCGIIALLWCIYSPQRYGKSVEFFFVLLWTLTSAHLLYSTAHPASARPWDVCVISAECPAAKPIQHIFEYT